MFQSYRKLVNTQLTFTCSKATIETLEALEKVNDVVLMSLLLTYFTPFMDGTQLSQGYRAITRRQFTFYHKVPISSWYSNDWPPKDERLSWPWSHPKVLNLALQHGESSVLLTTRHLLHKECRITWVTGGYITQHLLENLMWCKLRASNF